MTKQIINEKIRREIQTYIQTIRKDKSLTQEQLSEKCGITVKSLSDIETNRKGISLSLLIKVLTVLDINLFEVIKEHYDKTTIKKGSH